MFVGLILIPVYFYLINPPAMMCWDGVDEQGNMIGGCEPEYSMSLLSTIVCFVLWIIVFGSIFLTGHLFKRKKK